MPVTDKDQMGSPKQLSTRTRFADVDWSNVPDEPGVYVIYDKDEVIYVGIAGRNGRGSLRKRLKDPVQIAEITPSELERLQRDPAQLPTGWSLASARVFKRPQAAE